MKTIEDKIKCVEKLKDDRFKYVCALNDMNTLIKENTPGGSTIISVFNYLEKFIFRKKDYKKGTTNVILNKDLELATIVVDYFKRRISEIDQELEALFNYDRSKSKD